MNGDFSPSQALGHALRLMTGNWVGAAAAVALLTAGGTASDLLPESGTALFLFVSVLAIAFQDRLTSSALRVAGLEGDPRSRFWGVFGASFLAGIGIFLGFILLILPGLYLFARWALAIPILIEENRGPGEALRSSWDRTEGKVWPVFLTVLPVFLPVVTAFVLLVASDPAELPELEISLAFNAVLSLCQVAGWYTAVAIYVALVPRDSIAEIFT